MSISLPSGIIMILIGAFIIIFNKYYLNSITSVSFILENIIAKFFLFLGLFAVLYKLT